MAKAIKTKSTTGETSALAQQLMQLFPCSQRSFATWSPDTLEPEAKGKLVPKYVTVRRAITVADWEAHVSGQRAVVIPLRCDDDTTKVTLLDVDKYDVDPGALLKKIKLSGLPLYLSLSKSGGPHIVAFHDVPITVADSERLATELIRRLGLSGRPVEIFPPQQPPGPLPRDVNMPYFGGERGYLRLTADGTLEQLPTAEFLVTLVRMTAEQRAGLLATTEDDDAGRGAAFAGNMLERYRDEIAELPLGERNGRINTMAFYLATMAARGWVNEDTIEDELMAATQTAGWDNERKTLDTVRRAIRAGLKKPHGDLACQAFPDVTKDGRPRPTLANTKVALAQFGIECRYDLFKLRYLINGHQIENYVGEVSDPALLRLREMIYERFGFDPTTETVLTAVQTLANHAQFHPVRDYLDSLQWDGTPRISNWLTEYGGAEDTPYTRAVGELLLIAAVRRVRKPGCKFDELVVFESGQGTDKSQALQLLAVQPEWFSDNLPLGLSAKETIEALSGHWIVEASELQGMRKGEIEKVKAFLSRGTDRARMAYARTVIEARRQCVVVGTTNSEQYLRDLTGNRRFWPVLVVQFDLEALKRDRDQLWAEAAAKEAAGASIRLPKELWPAAALEQQARVMENPFLSALSEVLREKGQLTDDGWMDGAPMEGKIATEDLWTIVGLHRSAHRTQQHFDALADAMKTLGWTRPENPLRVGGGRRAYHYVKGDQPYRRIIAIRDKDSDRAYVIYEDSVGA